MFREAIQPEFDLFSSLAVVLYRLQYSYCDCTHGLSTYRACQWCASLLGISLQKAPTVFWEGEADVVVDRSLVRISITVTPLYRNPVKSSADQ
jgi:hypothetical protein